MSDLKDSEATLQVRLGPRKERARKLLAEYAESTKQNHGDAMMTLLEAAARTEAIARGVKKGEIKLVVPSGDYGREIKAHIARACAITDLSVGEFLEQLLRRWERENLPADQQRWVTETSTYGFISDYLLGTDVRPANP